MPFARFDEVSKIVSKIFNEVFKLECFCHHAHHSLLFRKKITNCMDEIAPIIELFYDGSIKLSVPIVFMQSEGLESSINRLKTIQPITNDALIGIIDGGKSLGLVCQTCEVVDQYLKAVDREINEYAIATEFENAQGMFIEFQTDAYEDYVRENGIPYIGTVDEVSKPLIRKSSIQDDDISVVDIVYAVFLESLCLPFATADEVLSDKVEKIMFGSSIENS